MEAFALLELLGLPFQAEGRPGEEDVRDEEAEEKAAEEARLKAEAEAAALEQLKEENPEAYARPEPTDEEGEDAEGGDAAEETE